MRLTDSKKKRVFCALRAEAALGSKKEGFLLKLLLEKMQEKTGFTSFADWIIA